MSCRPCPAAAALLDQATALWPNRSRASDGTCGDAAHAARTSDHNPDSRGIAHAADLTHDPAHGCDAHAQADAARLRALRGEEPRLKYVISNRRIASPSTRWNWSPYTGSNPHDKHAHFSIFTAHENDTSPWFTDTEEIDMAAADDIIKRIGEYEQDTRALVTGLIEKEVEEQAQKTRRVVLDLIEAVAKAQGVNPAAIRAALRPETRQILDKVD